MPDLLLDEWLWADLSGENGADRMAESESLLIRIYEICDKIILLRDSKPVNKAWQLCKSSNRGIGRIVGANFLMNSKKVRFCETHDLVDLPNEIAADVNLDDHYLVHLHLSFPDCPIITSDQRLIQTLERHLITCVSRDHFLANYGR